MIFLKLKKKIKKINIHAPDKATNNKPITTTKQQATMSHLENKTFSNFIEENRLDHKPHQQEGVEWCLFNERVGHVAADRTIRGGLIADEMGLGKTIEMIGTMYCNPKSRTLIVVPRALLEQWNGALTTLLTEEVLVYHGPISRKLSDQAFNKPSIVITTYGKISLKVREEPKQVHRATWDRIVYDEAHHLRNSKNNTFHGAMKLNADINWLMTGTPIQNKRSDFYSLCAAMKLPAQYYTKTENLVPFARNFILRRTKKEVGIMLPELSSHVRKVTWESEQERTVAEDIHSGLSFSNITRCQPITTAKMEPVCLLVQLLRARQCCVLPTLMKKQKPTLRVPSLKGNPLPNTATQQGKRTMPTSYGIKQPMTNSKVNAVAKHIIQRKNNNRPKLVFCHFRGEIDEIARKLRVANMNVAAFDGRIKQRERNPILNTTWDVLIMQIKTGCEGLNLQQYKDVYFVSPHWNPAVEDQAIARCHRIGQTEPVRIYHFIMEGFDEEDTTFSLDTRATDVQTDKRKLMTILEPEQEPEQELATTKGVM